VFLSPWPHSELTTQAILTVASGARAGLVRTRGIVRKLEGNLDEQILD
jgi:hypothetical protein